MQNMNRKQKFTLTVVGLVTGLFLLTWATGYSVAINTTPSMPRGLYLVAPADTALRGDIVAVCIPPSDAARLYRERDYLPKSTRCASNLAPVLKPIVAEPGDSVTLDKQGVWVNGELQRNSRIFDTDSQGRPIDHMPVPWHDVLRSGEYFLLANHIERSLDSRYYGTVSRSALIGKGYPLITF